jgi:hypothetical protein
MPSMLRATAREVVRRRAVTMRSLVHEMKIQSKSVLPDLQRLRPPPIVSRARRKSGRHHHALVDVDRAVVERGQQGHPHRQSGDDARLNRSSVGSPRRSCLFQSSILVMPRMGIASAAANAKRRKRLWPAKKFAAEPWSVRTRGRRGPLSQGIKCSRIRCQTVYL